MPTADGRLRGITVPAEAWERVFGEKPCDACKGRGALAQWGDWNRRIPCPYCQPCG